MGASRDGRFIRRLCLRAQVRSCRAGGWLLRFTAPSSVLLARNPRSSERCCWRWSPAPARGENTRTKVGAGAGAATGAVVGGAVGGWKGAAIGGVTGAAAGGVAGRALAIGMGETQPVAANDSPEGGRRIAA